MYPLNRREFVTGGTMAGLAAVAGLRTDIRAPGIDSTATSRRQDSANSGPVVTIDAKPAPLRIDTTKTAVIVCDMQNDFGAEGGMFQRAGIDISMIRGAVAPTKRVLTAARRVGMPVIYLKMGFQPDLSDAGAKDSPNQLKHMFFGGIGNPVRAPDGTPSRTLIRETWSTAIVPELVPEPSDIVIYKHRFSGFYQTGLEAILTKLAVKNLIITGCTTSVCVESTIRDAMFRDFSCVLLADCSAEPIGSELPRTNHEASLLLVERLFGWVSGSEVFLKALAPLVAAHG